MLTVDQCVQNRSVTTQCDRHNYSFDYYYYRTAAGAEIDLVLDGEFGLIPIEIKYGAPPKRQLRALDDFVKERDCRYGLVITNDLHPSLITERVINIPFTHLI